MASAPSTPPGLLRLKSEGSTPNRSPSKRKAPFIDDVDDQSTEKVSPTKRVKATTRPVKQVKMPGKTPVKSQIIARSYAECSPLDKMLIDEKEAGTGWAAIQKQWEQQSGEKVGKSTLPNRYSRLKDNFTVINEEDKKVLLECHKKVVDGFDREKWNLISKAMKAENVKENYTAQTLKRQHEKLIKAGAAVVDNPEAQLDFDAEEEE